MKLDPRFEKLRAMAQKELFEGIMPFWSTIAIDEENGGFYGEISDDNKPNPEAPKCLILGARLVWTFSSVYRLTGSELAKTLADRAYDYFIKHFYDDKTGGTYYMLHADGTPMETFKHIYGQSFSIYALAEYYRATGCVNAYDAALTIFNNVNKYAWDPVNKGYWEARSYDWTEPMAKKSNINPIPECTKTMNTHLHLIESFTALHLAKENPTVRNKLREMLNIFLHDVMNLRIHHFHMFFNDKYKPLTSDISPGHDIEGTWLLMEAAEALNEKEALDAARPICLNMARACLEESMGPDGAMCNEIDPVNGHIDDRRVWWVQAEAIVGYLNAYQWTGDEKFIDASLKCFEYVDRMMVDHKNGEWFAHLSVDGTHSPSTKANGWKTPYHNGRMCLEVLERAKIGMHTGH